MSDTLSLSLAKACGNREALLPIKGLVDALQAQLAQAQTRAAQEVADISAQLQGIAGYRQVSLVDDRANFERTVGQTAVALAVKADPEIKLNAAMAIWTNSATAYREAIGRTTPTQNPEGCLEEYLMDMTAAGNIAEPTWEAFRAWIYQTPLDKLGI